MTALFIAIRVYFSDFLGGFNGLSVAEKLLIGLFLLLAAFVLFLGLFWRLIF